MWRIGQPGGPFWDEDLLEDEVTWLNETLWVGKVLGCGLRAAWGQGHAQGEDFGVDFGNENEGELG
jgi:hypothetical protein